jgi:hypothetical protein
MSFLFPLTFFENEEKEEEKKRAKQIKEYIYRGF